MKVFLLELVLNIYICHLGQLETKIYLQTDTFSDPRLQRSKHGNNSDRSSEQQAMRALGQFLIPETIVVRGIENHVRKDIVKQRITLFCLLWKGKTIVLALQLALHMSPYHAAAVTKFG